MTAPGLRRPCEKCDFIGPELPTVVRNERDLHRAMHEFTEALFGPICDWLMRVLDRAWWKGPR